MTIQALLFIRNLAGYDRHQYPAVKNIARTFFG